MTLSPNQEMELIDRILASLAQKPKGVTMQPVAKFITDHDLGYSVGEVQEYIQSIMISHGLIKAIYKRYGAENPLKLTKTG